MNTIIHKEYVCHPFVIFRMSRQILERKLQKFLKLKDFTNIDYFYNYFVVVPINSNPLIAIFLTLLVFKVSYIVLNNNKTKNKIIRKINFFLLKC